MCLSKIDQKYKIYRYIGYQVMVKKINDDGKIYYESFYYNQTKKYFPEIWYEIEDNYIIRSNDRNVNNQSDSQRGLYKLYKSGYHIFLTRKECIDYWRFLGVKNINYFKDVIVKVQFTKVSCKGYLGCKKVIIAQKRKILKEMRW